MRKMYPNLRVLGPVGEPLGFHAVKDDELDQLYVAAAARGTSAATTLLRDAEARRAAHFYEKHGWRRTGTVTHHPPTPEGPFPLEVWRYEKRL